MKYLMNTQEAVEISGLSILAVRNEVRKGNITGAYSDNGKKTYRITRYAFYRNFLGWSDKQIEEYHSTERGKYWLNYEAKQGRKKGTACTVPKCN